MKIIMGLGNPGNEYHLTRHNFGFMALDFYFKQNNLSWQNNQKFHSIWAKYDDIIYLKPQTFYNDVGIAATESINFYKIPTNQFYVICDDFNLEFGQLRFREKGSNGGNNGLKSIENMLHTLDYPRLRIGSGNHELRAKLGDVNFVLGHFTNTEKELLPQILQKTTERITQIINS